MKKVYLTLTVLLLSLSASGQYRESHNILNKLMWDDKMLNIMLDTRMDFSATFQEGDLDQLGFTGQTMKIWFAGEIVPGIRYRVRHRLNKSQNAMPREGYSGATDHAWISFDLGKKWTITAGKQSIQLGTFEYDYNPADIYLGSMIYGDFDGYKAGVNTAFRFLGQTLNLQIANSDSPQFASTEYENKALAAAFLWEGNLFDGLLKTRWGYSAFQHTKSKFYQWVTLGTQLNVGDFTTELDYYNGNRDMNYGSIVSHDDLGLRYVQDQSASVNLKYDFGKWRPFIKGVWSERFDKGMDQTAYQEWGIQGVIEFYPFKNPLIHDLRFHLMYAYANTDFKGSFSSLPQKETHTILVGMRWLFKVK